MITINLVSNASMDVYPHNKLAAFRTVLAGNEGLTLEDFVGEHDSENQDVLKNRWEVALTSISFPSAFVNVQNGTFRVFKQDAINAKNSKILSIETGLYPDVDSIVKAMSNASTKASGPSISYVVNERLGRIELSLSDDKWSLTFVTSDLLNILGFDRSRTSLTGKGPHVSDFAVDPQLHHSLLVYTDIVSPQLVGNTKAQLLRLVPLIYEKAPHFASASAFGTSHMNVAMDHLEFREVVASRVINTILIELRTETGALFPFIDSGRVSMSLLFRRKV